MAYVGGKYIQAKWIYSFLPKRMKRYVEVFGGAMWVYVNSDIEADEVYYNDYNPFMANVFDCCRAPNTFLSYLDRVEAQNFDIFEKYKNYILDVKNKGSFEFQDFDLAAKYIYVVTQTFSGIMSEKAKMIFLDPTKYKSKYYSFKKRLNNPKIQSKLQKIKVFNQSYEDFIPMVDDQETWMYLDPPYYGTENLYAFHDFGINDHKKLANILNNCKSNWVLSYYDFKESYDFYPKDKFKREYKEYKKASMASKGKKQSDAVEMLVLKG